MILFSRIISHCKKYIVHCLKMLCFFVLKGEGGKGGGGGGDGEDVEGGVVNGNSKNKE